MSPEGSGRASGPSSADAYELELDLTTVSAKGRREPAVERPESTRPVAGSQGEASGDLVEITELDEAHDTLDVLRAGRREDPLAKRLRDFITQAAGERAAAALNLDFGSALARFHLEHSGHPESCPCNPCRQARLMR